MPEAQLDEATQVFDLGLGRDHLQQALPGIPRALNDLYPIHNVPSASRVFFPPLLECVAISLQQSAVSQHHSLGILKAEPKCCS
jgi:hypothetical protein